MSLSVFFELTRSKKYYILNIYLPSILCVVIASTSFWVQLDIAPARVALGITSFLTMVTKIYLINKILIKISGCPHAIYERGNAQGLLYKSFRRLDVRLSLLHFRRYLKYDFLTVNRLFLSKLL